MASSKDGRDIHIAGRVDKLQIHIVGLCKPSLPHEEDTEIAKPSSVGRLDGCHSGSPRTVVRTPPEPGGHRGDRASRDATAQESASVDSTRCTPVVPLIMMVHWHPPFLKVSSSGCTRRASRRPSSRPWSGSASAALRGRRTLLPRSRQHLGRAETSERALGDGQVLPDDDAGWILHPLVAARPPRPVRLPPRFQLLLGTKSIVDNSV